MCCPVFLQTTAHLAAPKLWRAGCYDAPRTYK
jgi:hypothetical protein